MWSMLDDRLRDDLRSRPEVTERLAELEQRVHSGDLAATLAVDDVWRLYAETR
jgi:hypothetical protein